MFMKLNRRKYVNNLHRKQLHYRTAPLSQRQTQKSRPNLEEWDLESENWKYIEKSLISTGRWSIIRDWELSFGMYSKSTITFQSCLRFWPGPGIYRNSLFIPDPGQKRKQLWNVNLPQVCTEVINKIIIFAITVWFQVSVQRDSVQYEINWRPTSWQVYRHRKGEEYKNMRQILL